LAVQLFMQATARQGRRITTTPGPNDPAATLSTLDADDTPSQPHPLVALADDQPGHYL
jgi:hypothetical protein